MTIPETGDELYEIRDDDGVIFDSYDEDEMDKIFDVMLSGEESLGWEGDLKLVKVLRRER